MIRRCGGLGGGKGRAMEKDRLVAFSDGVIAIIITIMVLELKVPHDATLDALVAVTPAFLSYALSFVYVAIYWNNHHHFFHFWIFRRCQKVFFDDRFRLEVIGLVPDIGDGLTLRKEFFES